MEIIELKIDELKPYKNNAKLHPKEQIEEIKKSIEQFGFNDPIAIWGKDNIIVAGHGRMLACKELGIEKVPCIRLDKLTDEERKAYTLAHNKLTMNSGFDMSILSEELSDLSIDMSDFGFDMDLQFYDPEYEKQVNAEETQSRVENILNLGIAQYDGVGKYDIPEIEPVYEIPEIDEWIGFNYVLSDKEPKGKGVHFFIDDYQFIRIWNNPEAYVERLKEYDCVIAPDFSPYGDMPHVTQIYNHYRKHWVACYLQSKGVTVIPCIRASTDERSLEWFTDGEPKESIVAYSSMWTKENTEQYVQNKLEWDLMIERLHPKKILVYGKVFDFMKCQNIKRIQTFAEKRWNKE